MKFTKLSDRPDIRVKFVQDLSKTVTAWVSEDVRFAITMYDSRLHDDGSGTRVLIRVIALAVDEVPERTIVRLSCARDGSPAFIVKELMDVMSGCVADGARAACEHDIIKFVDAISMKKTELLIHRWQVTDIMRFQAYKEQQHEIH